MSLPITLEFTRKAENAVVSPFFSDDFAGTQTNDAGGFTWGGAGTRTAVVTFDGFNAMRFRYGPDASGSDSNAERRFNLGRNVAHLFVEYDWYVPTNYVHRNDVDTDNNKFFLMWRDNYSDVAGGTWRVAFEMDYAATGSNIRGMSSRWNYNSQDSSNPFGDYSPTGQGSNFIGGTGPINKGAWNQIRLEYKTASNGSSADGIVRMWVNGSLYYEITNGKFWNYETGSTPTDCHLRNGYFMGWSNSGFADETDFYVKAVKFYDTNPMW